MTDKEKKIMPFSTSVTDRDGMRSANPRLRWRYFRTGYTSYWVRRAKPAK